MVGRWTQMIHSVSGGGRVRNRTVWSGERKRYLSTVFVLIRSVLRKGVPSTDPVGNFP